MKCLLPYLCMVTVPHIMVGLERMLDYRGVGLERMLDYRGVGLERMLDYRGVGLERFHCMCMCISLLAVSLTRYS